jgi:hypothetical protein
MRWVGHVALCGIEVGHTGDLVWNPDGKRPRGKPRRRREDNIKMDLHEVGCGTWTGLLGMRIRTDNGRL